MISNPDRLPQPRPHSQNCRHGHTRDWRQSARGLVTTRAECNQMCLCIRSNARFIGRDCNTCVSLGVCTQAHLGCDAVAPMIATTWRLGVGARPNIPRKTQKQHEPGCFCALRAMFGRGPTPRRHVVAIMGATASHPKCACVHTPSDTQVLQSWPVNLAFDLIHMF